MKYNDIPIHERINEIKINRDESDILKLYNRISECRDWMSKNNLITKIK